MYTITQFNLDLKICIIFGHDFGQIRHCGMIVRTLERRLTNIYDALQLLIIDTYLPAYGEQSTGLINEYHVQRIDGDYNHDASNRTQRHMEIYGIKIFVAVHEDVINFKHVMPRSGLVQW